MRPKKDGFTLIELLAVIVIIGILAMIALPNLLESRERAFESSVQSDLRNLMMVQSAAHREGQAFQADLSELDFVPSQGVEIVILEATGSGWSARAEHSSLPGERCWVRLGSAAVPDGMPEEEANRISCTF